MKKWIFSVFIMTLAVSMLLGGCKKNVGTPEDNAVEEEVGSGTEEKAESTHTFGYSCIDMGNPYFETLQKSIEITSEENGFQLITKNPGSDVELQIQQIQEMIDEGVSAVFLCPVDWEKITPALEALKKAGIPVINIDTQVKNADLVDAYIGSDNKKAGYLCGADLIKQRPDGGKIVILERASLNSINERITGFEEAIANAGFEVLERVDAGAYKEQAEDEMKQILDKYPEIDAVMCGNDQAALGVLQALKEAGRSNVLVYGVDGSPEVKSELAKPGSFMAGTGAQSPINIGIRAVETGIAILNGSAYEKDIYIDTFFLGKNNIELYGTDGWQ
ncbi:MAG: sugar ABC transporter substrate-binding protein [Muricomes sp.]